MNFVIGSGPAGVSAAAALLERGVPVTMLDAGGSLDAHLQSQVDVLAGQPAAAWRAEQLESLKGPLRLNAEGAPLKLVFGSDYLYRDVESLQPVEADGVDAYRALATGGLSVVWGASILPYSDDDLAGWPIDARALHDHYVAALGLTGMAAVEDRLADLYPLHVAPTSPIDLSAQARFILERMTRHAPALGDARIHFGAARLALSGEQRGDPACARCGMCLYGCPYGLIYSAERTLTTLLARSPRFTYEPGVIVTKVQERSGGVTIEAVARDGRAPRRFEGDRAYVAAGVLGSTAIALRSIDAYDRPVLLQQSDHFLLPLLLRRRTGRASREQLHTLSQLFLEIRDAAVSPRGVHLQIYTYNDLYLRMAQRTLGPFYRAAAPAVERLVDRLVIIKGYLHSAESSAIRATLRRTGGFDRLQLSAVEQPQSDETIRGVVRLLMKNRTRIGAMPIPFSVRKGLPGSGVHVGSSFPMRREPGPFDSDVLGRPSGFTRVHMVDSAVFPSVPAAPPTLTIMANAHRIAAGDPTGSEHAA